PCGKTAARFTSSSQRSGVLPTATSAVLPTVTSAVLPTATSAVLPTATSVVVLTAKQIRKYRLSLTLPTETLASSSKPVLQSSKPVLQSCQSFYFTKLNYTGMSVNFNRVAPDVKLGKDVRIHAFTNLYGCEIGDNVKIGTFVEIQKGARIGNNCKISSHSFIC